MYTLSSRRSQPLCDTVTPEKLRSPTIDLVALGAILWRLDLERHADKFSGSIFLSLLGADWQRWFVEEHAPGLAHLLEGCPTQTFRAQFLKMYCCDNQFRSLAVQVALDTSTYKQLSAYFEREDHERENALHKLEHEVRSPGGVEVGEDA